MTIENCQKCANYGVFGACRVEQTTSGDWSCNFVPKDGSATIIIHNTESEIGTFGAKWRENKMTFNEARNILAVKFYGTKEGKEINKILNQVDENSWNTGKPIEEGWYLLKIKCDDEIIYETNQLIQCLWGLDWRYAGDEVIGWKKIEE